MIKRMVSAEQKAFLELQAATRMLELSEPPLARRIKDVPGGNRYLHTAQGMLKKLIEEMNDTMPDKQAQHLENQKASLKMIVGTNAQMPRDSDAEFGRWLSFHQLDVVATAIRECCRACTIDNPQDQKQCMFCKLLEVLPTDKPDENATGCGYFTIWGGY